MSEIWKVLLPVLLAAVGVMLMGVYKEVRTLDKEIMSRETIELEIQHLEWRIKKLEDGVD